MVGTDIDCRAVRKLRKVSESWRTGVCDFMNPRSRQSSPVLRSLNGRTNLVLLNPPFSCRGGQESICHSRRDHIKMQPRTGVRGKFY